ncbi:MAG: ribonuclease HI family protein [Candidatus Buchananbacteria bacterium]|nr:ribonuclease HI family protein [Candidatus Buchananbacteria bacterium]
MKYTLNNINVNIMIKAILHTDGGARGNPGPAGLGAVLEMGDDKLFFKKYIGEATNNQAEYQALILGLTKAQERGVAEVDCYLDSELVVKQLNREYKVKNEGIAPLFIKVWNLTQQFKKVKFIHVFREDNKEADKLVNEAIDKAV